MREGRFQKSNAYGCLRWGRWVGLKTQYSLGSVWWAGGVGVKKLKVLTEVEHRWVGLKYIEVHGRLVNG